MTGLMIHRRVLKCKPMCDFMSLINCFTCLFFLSSFAGNIVPSSFNPGLCRCVFAPVFPFGACPGLAAWHCFAPTVKYSEWHSVFSILSAQAVSFTLWCPFKLV